MSPDFISADVVRDLAIRVQAARQAATDALAATTKPHDTPAYWEAVFEANAASALSVFGRVRLPDGFTVRYRFYGRRGGDLLVRPFVARSTTDVDAIRQLIDWHPPPDATSASARSRPSRDVDFLYRHFSFERSPEGFFEYWLAMQELWASAEWIHSRVIADRAAFETLTQREGWRVDNPVERYEPALVLAGDGGAEAMVLLSSPLGRQRIDLHHIRIGADQSIEVAETIPVAQGPRGYQI